jgi:hypothetical protein
MDGVKANLKSFFRPIDWSPLLLDGVSESANGKWRTMDRMEIEA